VFKFFDVIMGGLDRRVTCLYRFGRMSVIEKRVGRWLILKIRAVGSNETG